MFLSPSPSTFIFRSSNLPHIDPTLPSFSSKLLTPSRQRVNSLISSLRQKIGRSSSSHLTLQKPSSVCKCSLGQAMIVQKLSQKIKSQKTFVKMVEHIENDMGVNNQNKGDWHKRGFNQVMKEEQYRNGVYYRRSQISKNIKFLHKSNKESLQQYKRMDPISLDIEDSDKWDERKEEKPLDKIIRTISTASTNKRVRREKIRFVSTRGSVWKDEE